MTETDWLACTDPTPMLAFLRGKASDRKLRLFSVACVRRAWESLEKRSRRMIEMAEQYADGLVAPEAIDETPLREEQAERGHDPSAFGIMLESGGSCSSAVAAATAVPAEPEEAARQMRYSERTCHGVSHEGWADIAANAQCQLLRDLFGALPFRPATANRVWLTWNDGAIPKLAHAVYDERAFDRLPVLADALEEAGCTDAAILGHCRQPGEHVRGCWVVDLLLGKS
jgi:hypothetical protein